MDTTWYDAIEDAASVTETVAVVRSYLSGLTERDRALLPAQCAPHLIHSDDDVDDLTQRLFQLHREGRQFKWSSAVLDETFAYFVHASLHIARLNRVRANNNIVLLKRAQPQMR